MLHTPGAAQSVFVVNKYVMCIRHYGLIQYSFVTLKIPTFNLFIPRSSIF